MLRPTGAMLGVSVLICLCLMGQSAATQPNTADPLNKIKEFNSNFINHVQQSELSLVQPQLTGKEIFYPQASHSAPAKENIVMNCSHSEQQVQNMHALNSNKQRDIVFDDTQSGDTKNKGLKNSVDITVRGNSQGQSKGNEWLDESSDDMGIENLVDNALSSLQHDGPVYDKSSSDSPGQQRLGNYMNIDVSGINVQAINTVQGGSAVATSNIEIKPVQIINCPPEVEEKLK